MNFEKERNLCKAFAECFAIYQASDKSIQKVVEDMCFIMNSSESNDDEKQAALVTLQEALFPSMY